jgi:RHS repeat-associated protein
MLAVAGLQAHIESAEMIFALTLCTYTEKGAQSPDCKYTFSRNVVSGPVNNGVSGQTTARKYVVDIVGDLPTILMEIDLENNMAIKKTYIYSNGEILAQHTGGYTAPIYYYLHDRLGSVRQIIDPNGKVVNRYMYEPFGAIHLFEQDVVIDNSFKFTGQYYDSEIDQYDLRARQYYPRIQSFTSKDPVAGKFDEPISLHVYLYCGNNPINFVDLDGKWAVVLSGSVDVMLSTGIVGKAASSGLNSIEGGLGYQSMMRQALIGLLLNDIDAGVGGEGGAGIAFGHGEDGWFFGSLQYLAGGGGITNGTGGALNFNFGISPDAQKLDDLAGGYTQYGGSAVIPAPIGSIFFGMSVGGSLSVGDNGVKTWTVSAGPAYWSWMTGWEGHVYRGYTWVQPW